MFALFGSDISQYREPDAAHKIAYLTKNIQIGPKLEALLKPAKSRLKTRRETRAGKIPWHALHWPRNKAIFEQPKILVQGIRNLQLRKRIIATLDENDYYAGVNLNIVNLKPDAPVSLEYLLAIFNSRDYWFAQSFIDHRIKNSQLETVPIPVRGPQFDATIKKLEAKVIELRSAIRNEEARSSTASLRKARAHAAREAIETMVEDLYQLDENARKVINTAYCNGGPQATVEETQANEAPCDLSTSAVTSACRN